jgi:AcrR family transcriptional regulator
MICEAFIKMLNERPLNKITVKAIAAACEINRNTFYYYYTDVYALLSELFQTELQTVIDEYNDTLSWEESFIVATKFALENHAERRISELYLQCIRKCYDPVC